MSICPFETEPHEEFATRTTNPTSLGIPSELLVVHSDNVSVSRYLHETPETEPSLVRQILGDSWEGAFGHFLASQPAESDHASTTLVDIVLVVDSDAALDLGIAMLDGASGGRNAVLGYEETGVGFNIPVDEAVSGFLVVFSGNDASKNGQSISKGNHHEGSATQETYL